MLFTLLGILLVLFLVSVLLESVVVGGIGGVVLLVLLVLLLLGKL